MSTRRYLRSLASVDTACEIYCGFLKSSLQQLLIPRVVDAKGIVRSVKAVIGSFNTTTVTM